MGFMIEMEEEKLDKLDAIFEMLQTLDEKITNVNSRFNKLIIILGYDV